MRGWTKLLFGVAAGILLWAGRGAVTDAQAPAPASLVWPNPDSKANSDDWIRLHHNEIKQMKPRVLVLNFVNGLTTVEAQRRVDAVIAAIREASRYQGYKNKDAPSFLEYQTAKIVDLTDEAPLPEEQRMEGNSSLYPRVPNWQGGNNFRYGELYTEAFTRALKFALPDRPNEYLSIDQLVSRGLVHEVWILALQGRFGAPHDCVEVKQGYDANSRKIASKSVQAGTGKEGELPFIGRSLRILYINPERGAGCTLEKIGRAFETTAASGAIPYFSRYFNEFAGLNLKQAYRVPFEEWGGREPNSELDYPTPDSVLYRYKGEQFGIRNYVAPPGSVRFPPNARRDFDIENMTPVLTNIEHYRMRDGANGRDKAEPYTNAKIARDRQVAPDCVGAWMVFWQQSMPGLDNKAVDDLKLPMKNWWAFLFY